MNKIIAIVIAPNWGDYAKKYLHDCMESIRAQDYAGDIKIYLTDNETSGESYNLIRKLAPEVELVLNMANDGFAKGCNDCLRQALQSSPQYIIFVNMDTVLDKSCVRKLVESADENKKAALIQARIMLWDEKSRINSLGNNSHFLGFGFSEGYNQEWDKVKGGVKEGIMYPSGAGFLLRTEFLEEIGLFDEQLWMYNEDQDMGWKSLLAGHKNILAKEAVLYHKYEFAKSIKQYYYMDRNRIIEMLKNYRMGTLLLIFPAFIFMELGLLAFSLRGGWFKEKLRVWAYFFSLKHWVYIIRERRLSSKIRKVGDREILKSMTGKIWYQEIDDWKLKFINPFFNFYFKILKFIIIW